MAVPLIPIIAIAAIAMFAGGGGKKRKKPVVVVDNGTDTGPRWLSAGALCDPLDQSNVPPGFGCFAGEDGSYYVMEDYDPAKAPTLNYGAFGDAQGVAEALELLGFTQGNAMSNTARFQEYAYEYFGLKEGSLRFDGRLDNKTLQFLKQALVDYESGRWVAEEEFEIEQQLLDFEYDNAATVVSAWTQDPLLGWEFPDGEFVQPNVGGQPLSTWLTNAVYWGTYDVGGQSEPGASMPKKFWPVPYTDQWDSEADAREVWIRIQDYVQLLMEETGLADETIFPEDANA